MHPLKLFIVEDDPDDQEIFMMALGKLTNDVSCRFANNGMDALDLLQVDSDYVPDIIFLDINMPKMGGLQCLPELRKVDRLKNAKIIMFSTTKDADIIQTSKKLGATDYVVKPTGLKTLSESLLRIIRSGM